MSSLQQYTNQFGQNWKLAMPIIMGQLGQVMVNVADNIMVGRLGAAPLAGVSYAIALFAIVFVVGFGISFGLPPLVSEADGANEKHRVTSLFHHSLIINILYSFIAVVAVLLLMQYMDNMGQDPSVVVYAKEYLLFVGLSMIPFMIFQTFRCTYDGLSLTLYPMIVIILCNLINIGLNYVLIYGHLGFEAMGVKGASLATLISRSLMVLMIIIFVIRMPLFRSLILVKEGWRYSYQQFRRILNLGIPTSMQMFFEVTAFSVASLIMGLISKEALAAHQLSINLASTTFMICTGLAMAATIRVGNQYGKQDYIMLRIVGLSGILQVVLLMAVFAIIFIVFRDYLPLLYIKDQSVVDIAAVLLVMAAIFQIPDGVQVTAISALRGLQDVKVPTVMTIASYWLVGIPMSYAAAIWLDMGPAGVWLGLVFGLSLSAFLNTYRFHLMTRRLVGGK